MSEFHDHQVKVIISDFVLFPQMAVSVLMSQLYKMADEHRKFCIRSHGCIVRPCLFSVVVPLIPPHMAIHPKTNVESKLPVGYVNGYSWFQELIGAIRQLNVKYNKGRSGFSSKKAFNWEDKKYLNRWEPVGRHSIFVNSKPGLMYLKVRAVSLHKWAVSRLSEEHL